MKDKVEKLEEVLNDVLKISGQVEEEKEEEKEEDDIDCQKAISITGGFNVINLGSGTQKVKVVRNIEPQKSKINDLMP